MQMSEDGNRVSGKVVRGRGCNESFRAAVDRLAPLGTGMILFREIFITYPFTEKKYNKSGDKRERRIIIVRKIKKK